MTNPVIKRVTTQVQRLHLRMILTYVILVQSTLAIFKVWKSSNRLLSWDQNFLSAELSEPIFPMTKSIKFGKRTVVWDLDLWASTHGSCSEAQGTK